MTKPNFAGASAQQAKQRASNVRSEPKAGFFLCVSHRLNREKEEIALHELSSRQIVIVIDCRVRTDL